MDTIIDMMYQVAQSKPRAQIYLQITGILHKFAITNNIFC